MNAFDGTPTISLNTQRFESSPSVRTIAREIKFAFQPIIHLETGATHGVEALMRGQEALGFKYITDVFDAAYLAGDLAELEARLLERAITEFLASKLPNTLRLFFNLDPRTVVSLGNVLQVIAPVLHKLAMDPKRLCLEINERVDLDPSGETARQLHDIRNAGIRVALDDFGIGFSRLKVLHDGHADYVKFDRYFISNVSNEPKKRVFLSTMLDMFHLLGVTTVAEGIETEFELRTCRELGFGLAQGYYIARPTIGLENSQEYYHFPDMTGHWTRGERSMARGLIGVGSPDAISLSQTLKQVQQAFLDNPHAPALPVVDSTGRPVGIIREADIRATLKLGQDAQELFDAPSSQGLMDHVRPCPVVETGATAETMLHAYATAENHGGVLLVENSRFVGFLGPEVILRLLHESNLALTRDQNLLTKLPGSSYISDFIDTAANTRDLDWMLIQFNFDAFKIFNDRFGFQQGDRAIVMFADRLKRWYLGDSAMLGHDGGDCFTLALKGPDVASVTTATYALRRAFAEDTVGFQGPPARSSPVADGRKAQSLRTPSLTCRAAMLLLKSGRPVHDQKRITGSLSNLDQRAKAEGGFAFGRIG